MEDGGALGGLLGLEGREEEGEATAGPRAAFWWPKGLLADERRKSEGHIEPLLILMI